MAEEPSVLDYVKSLLTPWRGAPLKIPPEEGGPSFIAESPLEAEPSAEMGEAAVSEAMSAPTPAPAEAPIVREAQPLAPSLAAEMPLPSQPEPTPPVEPAGPLPWRLFLALGLALLAQRVLEPVAGRTWDTGVILYLLAAGWYVWASLRSEWAAAHLPAGERRQDPLTVNRFALMVGIPMAIIGYFFFGGNRFTAFNLFWGGCALAFTVYGFWLGAPRQIGQPWRRRLSQFIRQRQWTMAIPRWSLVLLVVTALVAFFRFSNLAQAPPEMTSDHAEKILDISRVLQGQTSIFFPNNGGREALQMYLVAALVRYLGADLNFLSLKIITTLVGFLSLPFLYLLGKEVGNRRVGLLAFAFAGVSYWGNLVSRVGLRLPFYFLFTASTLYFLARGIRTSRRNDFILAGLSLGLSMYGYSADRILPLVVLTAVGLYLLHWQSTGQRQQTIWATLVLLLIAALVFIPLLHYMVDEPGGFLQRTLTRMSTSERPLPGPAWEIFLKNLWRAVIMFSWGDGEVWLVSVPHRPALDVAAGALFWSGVVLLLVRYARRRHWLDLFLILSIPLLMLPSILSLAFPNENPNLYRTGGALIPVFLILALALDGMMRALRNWLGKPRGLAVAWILALFLLAWSAYQSYDLVFRQHYRIVQESAWNTSEMGQVIRSFAQSVGSPDTAWLVGYPHWADSRVLGIAAGYPTKDFAIWPDQFETTLADPRPKLFLLRPDDQANIDLLSQLYPQGWLQRFSSQVPTKDFLIFFVPSGSAPP